MFLVLRFLAVLLALPPISAPDSQAALQKAAPLVQQGRLDEADQQARLALADPETRAVAYSVLGTIRFARSASTRARLCSRRRSSSSLAS